MRAATLLLMTTLAASAQPAISKRLASDTALNADPASSLWKDAPALTSETSPRGEPAPGHKLEVRSRWTPANLYVLFICPYQDLYLRDNPSTTTETNKLWEWDVAELFVGGDFEHIWQYREFQVSPQAEWVDLDIDRHDPKPEGGWLWNSGFTVAAHLDRAHNIWYGAMKIPWASVNGQPAPAAAGREYRANFYRIQGPPPHRVFVSWRPTGPTGNHHVPDAFGILRLEN